MGGDREELVWLAADALTESGELFEVGCSHGMVRVPAEAASSSEALVLTDQRMYAEKAGRSSASRQSTDVLLMVLNERDSTIDEHVADVARLAAATAEALGLPDHEVKRIALGAELHDVGKTAIPESILLKAGPLDPEEWKFMGAFHGPYRRHVQKLDPVLDPVARNGRP